MAFDTIFSNINATQMRNQLSEISAQNTNNGFDSSFLTFLLLTKEAYTKAKLASHADRLRVLLEAHENGEDHRSDTQGNVYTKCRNAEQQFLDTIVGLERRARGIMGPCDDCEVFRKNLENAHRIISALQKTIEDNLASSTAALEETCAKNKTETEELVKTHGEDVSLLKKDLATATEDLGKKRTFLEETLLYKVEILKGEQDPKSLAAAESAVESLIQLRREILGSSDVSSDERDDSTLLNYRYQLSEIQMRSGNPTAAETTARSLFEKIKAVPELGEKSADGRKSLRQWCSALRHLGGDEEKFRAELMYRTVWFLNKDVSDRLWRIENGYELGRILEDRGEKMDARSQYRRVWDKRKSWKTTTGSDTRSLDQWAYQSGLKLGSLILEDRTQKSYKEAAGVLSHVWGIVKSILPEYHDDSITTAELLYKTYHGLKDLEKEEELCVWLSESYRATGKEAARIHEILFQLGEAQFKREKFKAAAGPFKEVWVYRQTPEACHWYCDALFHHSQILVQQHRYTEAQPLLKECWELRKSMLEKDDQNTLASGHLYGVVLSRLDDPKSYAEAEEILKQVWGVMRSAFPKTEQTMTCGYDYGVVLLDYANVPRKASKISEARSVLKLVWEQRCEVLSSSHPDTLESGYQYVAAWLEYQDGENVEDVISGIYKQRLADLPTNDLLTLKSALLYGRVLVENSDSKGNSELELAALKDREAIFRHLWKLRSGSQIQLPSNMLLQAGTLLALTLRDLGGSHLQEASVVISEVMKMLPPPLVPGLPSDNPLMLEKKDIEKRLDDWQKGVHNKPVNPLFSTLKQKDDKRGSQSGSAASASSTVVVSKRRRALLEWIIHT